MWYPGFQWLNASSNSALISTLKSLAYTHMHARETFSQRLIICFIYLHIRVQRFHSNLEVKCQLCFSGLWFFVPILLGLKTLHMLVQTRRDLLLSGAGVWEYKRHPTKEQAGCFDRQFLSSATNVLIFVTFVNSECPELTSTVLKSIQCF